MTAAAQPDPRTWLDGRKPEILERLSRLIAIPSVSTQEQHRGDVVRCAEWLASELRRIGFSADCHATSGHPIVLAEWRGAPAGAPTVLIYAHYDVQPPEPVEPWLSPPFVATVREGRLYARGAADDKGQLWIHVSALEACLQVRGTLPINVLLVVEGEEEVGSPNLSGFLDAHRDRLTCDAILISDTMMLAPGIPNLLSSMRGLAYFELTARSAPADLHSGQYGGVVANAATGLARVLASLHTGDGRIAIPGFYDAVTEPSAERREQLARLPFDERRFQSEVGVATLTGEEGFSTLERLWLRPTCEVNGVNGGYTGEGAKTIIPSVANAKLSFRLVPDQTPELVERLLRGHLASMRLPGIQLELWRVHGALPWTADSEGPAAAGARRVLAEAFGHDAVVGGTGGSIPIVPELERVLGTEIVLMGFGLPGENAHAPNEWLDLETFWRGIGAAIDLYGELGCIRE
ncbi:MAG TPA: dipeptidase [Gemmatimonadales bacterium]